MNCESARKGLSLFLYGELAFEEEEALQQHLDVCEGCREALEREKRWHEATDLHEVAPPAELLTQCRRDLRLRLDAVREQQAGARGLFAGLKQFLSAGYMRPAAAVVLVLLGFFAARFTTPRVSGPIEPDVTLAGPVATEVRYLQPDSTGGVRIVLDETRQRVLSGSLEDEGIRQALLTAARDASDPGLRVESVDILRGRAESTEVRKAFLQALQHDPNAGVRLKAIEGLKSFAADPEIRTVLAEVLLSDDNPGVRTQAIDLLVQHKEVSMAGVLQELLHKEENDYVRLRCQKALREMNASVGTF